MDSRSSFGSCYSLHFLFDLISSTYDKSYLRQERQKGGKGERISPVCNWASESVYTSFFFNIIHLLIGGVLGARNVRRVLVS